MKLSYVPKERAGVMAGVAGLAVLGMAATPAGTIAESVLAPDAGCALPSEPQGILAALDAAITGRADKDRACMRALLIPEGRMIFVSLGTGGAPTYRIEILDAGPAMSGEFL